MSRKNMPEITRAVLEAVTQSGDAHALARVRLLAQRISLPEAWITLVGETSTGKSTLINALLQDEVLPAGATPTSGTVVQILCREVEADRFLAICRNATQEDITPAQFRAFSQKPPADLLRLQLHTSKAGAAMSGLQVFDTPGYNSLAAEHEEVLQAFLPESDMVILTTGYRSGFGQADQDLFESVGAALAADDTVPVMLVINRAPAGCSKTDRRVVEIMANATDSIKKKLDVVIVETAMPPAEGVKPLPEAAHLWQQVKSYALSAQRRQAVHNKLVAALITSVNDAIAAVERRLAALTFDRSHQNRKFGLLDELQKARNDSNTAINEHFTRLQNLLPATVAKLAGHISSRITELIEASDKWLGYEDCLLFVEEHALPTEARRAGRQVEEIIAGELEKLNQTIEDIANTAIQRINRRIEMESTILADFGKSLIITLTNRILGQTALAGIKGLGGVGGVAAGTGNLVKMLMKRAGGLFGVKFSREFYTTIGRTFNKRMVQVLGNVFYVAIEAGRFIYDAHRWKGKLKKQVSGALDTWKHDITTEIMVKQLPALKEANVELVEAYYSDLIAETGRSTEQNAAEAEFAHLRALLGQLQSLREQLCQVNPEME